ncbi:MAG: hypothetical protein IKB60_00635 [Clostridia bacterium]|nr:hypothetical protein [Clostridia bacterium]
MKKQICLILSILMLLSVLQISALADDRAQIGNLPLVGINEVNGFGEDFGSYQAGTYVPADGGVTPVQLAGTGSFEVTSSGGLKATTTGGGERKITLRYNFTNPVNTGLIAVGMTLDNNETSITDTISSWLLFTIYNTSDTPETALEKFKTAINGKANGTLHRQPQPDANGKCHLIYTARRESAQEDWVVEIYDVAGAEPALVYNRTMASSYGNISYIDFVRSYSASTTSIAIDDISVKTYESYEISSSSSPTATPMPTAQPGGDLPPVNDAIDFDEDFSGFQTGSYTATQGGITTETLAGSGSFEITEAGALKAATTGGGECKITLRYTLPTPVNTGLLSASMTLDNDELSITDAISSWNLFAVYNESGTVEPTIEKFKDTIMGKSKTPLIVQPQQDENGDYHLLYMARRETVSDNWIVEAYDIAGTEPVLVYKREIDASFGGIKFIDFVRSYSTGITTIAIDNISVKTYEIDCNGANPASSALTLSLSEDNIVGDLSAVLTDGEETIEAAVSYDSNNQELSIMPESFLDYATTYQVSLTGCKLPVFSFTTAKAQLSISSKTLKFVGQNGESETVPESGEFDAVCDVSFANPGGDEACVYMVLISYNESGRITNVTTKQADFTQTTYQDQIKFEDLTKAKATRFECLIWHKTNLGYEMMR